MQTGFLIEINNLKGTGKASGKAYDFHLAIFSIDNTEESIVISSAKAEEMRGNIEQEFHITYRNVTLYTKEGEPRIAKQMSVGRCLAKITKAK